MTISDQIKILNKQNLQNEPQYDLDRKAAKISAYSSNNLDKYEYLTGEELGLKLSTVEKAKFEYSPLGKIFNKGLDKDDQKEGLFKRLKNIEKAQKGLINGNNKPDSVRSKSSKSSILSIFDSISSKSEDKDEDEDENERTTRELYQDSGMENMKRLIMAGEKIKDEKSQMCLENNLKYKIKLKTKLKINLLIFTINIQGFLGILLIKKKRILTTKYFQIKLMILIFIINMTHCTIICLSLV